MAEAGNTKRQSAKKKPVSQKNQSTKKGASDGH
jgi:hypothetical protein